MSEFSESYHIYAQDFLKTHKTLKLLGLNGILFKPKRDNKWCTFIPFEPADFVPSVAYKYISSPIMTYFYAEDHGWSIQLVTDQPPLRYDCSWEEKVKIETEDDFINKLEKLLDVNIDEELKSLLFSTDIDTILHKNPAYMFCAAIGLDKFNWLSPAYILEDLDNYKKRKDCKLVGEVPEKVRIDQPNNTKIKLPEYNLSAKEAEPLVTPYIKQWAMDAEPDFMSNGRIRSADFRELTIDLNGRITKFGTWNIRYISFSKGVLLWVALSAKGDIEITYASKINLNYPFEHWHKDRSYHDSTEVFQCLMEEHVTKKPDELFFANICAELSMWSTTLAWNVMLDYRLITETRSRKSTWILGAHDLNLLRKL